MFFLLKGSGNKEFPEYNPQDGLCSSEENRASPARRLASVYTSVSQLEIPFRVSGSAAYSSSSSMITTMPPILLFSSFLVILMILGTTPSGCSSMKYASSLSQSFSSSQPLK